MSPEPEPGDWSPSLGGGAPDGSLAPSLGARRRAPSRAWWHSMKGPIAVLLADLENASPVERRRAAEALVRLGDRRAVPALAVAAKDADWQVRLAAIQAIRRLGGDAVREPLHRACTDGHPHVRLAAAEGLAEHGDRSSLPVLEALLAHVERYGLERDREPVAAALAAVRRRLDGALDS